MFVSRVIDALVENLVDVHPRGGVANIRISALQLLRNIAQFPQGKFHHFIVDGGSGVRGVAICAFHVSMSVNAPGICRCNLQILERTSDTHRSDATKQRHLSGSGLRILERIGKDFTTELKREQFSVRDPAALFHLCRYIC